MSDLIERLDRLIAADRDVRGYNIGEDEAVLIEVRDTIERLQRENEELRGRVDALPAVAAPPGKPSEEFLLGRHAGQRDMRDKLDGKYERILDTMREHSVMWRTRARTAEGELRALRRGWRVTEAMARRVVIDYEGQVNKLGGLEPYASTVATMQRILEVVFKTGHTSCP